MMRNTVWAGAVQELVDENRVPKGGGGEWYSWRAESAETGKSTSIKAGLSLFGMTKDGFYVEGSIFYGEECSVVSAIWCR